MNDESFRTWKEGAMGSYKEFHEQLEETHYIPVTYAIYLSPACKSGAWLL
jgi:hypothetical protein